MFCITDYKFNPIKDIDAEFWIERRKRIAVSLAIVLGLLPVQVYAGEVNMEQIQEMGRTEEPAEESSFREETEGAVEPIEESPSGEETEEAIEERPIEQELWENENMPGEFYQKII